MSDLHVDRPGDERPDSFPGPTIFLAGPTPRGESVESWRPMALRLLKALGFSGTVHVPEPESGFREDDEDHVDWELDRLRSADLILFWVPRNVETLPGFTTNVEFGYWLSQRPDAFMYGRPKSAPKTAYLDKLYDAATSRCPANRLAELLEAAVQKLVRRDRDAGDPDRNVALFIDCQNDFCDPQGSLYVPGAAADMRRAAGWLDRQIGPERALFTLDWHPPTHVGDHTSWSDPQGACPAPFEEITAKQVERGRWRFAETHLQRPNTKLWADSKIRVWPPHCRAGTWGSAVHPTLAAAANRWAARTGRRVEYFLKGRNPLQEEFSAAEAVRSGDQKPQELFVFEHGSTLSKILGESDGRIFVCGEAGANCVAATLVDLFRQGPLDAKRLSMIWDAVSCVPGTEQQWDDLTRELIEAGASAMRTCIWPRPA